MKNSPLDFLSQLGVSGDTPSRNKSHNVSINRSTNNNNNYYDSNNKNNKNNKNDHDIDNDYEKDPGFLEHFGVLVEEFKRISTTVPEGYYVASKRFKLNMFYFLSEEKKKSSTPRGEVYRSVRVHCRVDGCARTNSYNGNTSPEMISHLQLHYHTILQELDGHSSSYVLPLVSNSVVARAAVLSSLVCNVPRSYHNSNLFALMFQSIVYSFVHQLEAVNIATDEIWKIAREFRPGKLSPYTFNKVKGEVNLEGRAAVKDAVSSAPFIHYGTDGWDQSGRHFQALIASGIAMKNGLAIPFEYLLGLSLFPPECNHGGPVAAEIVEDVLEEFGLLEKKSDLVSAFVCDSAPVNLSMLESNGLKHFQFVPCSGHLQNNVIKNAAVSVPVIFDFLAGLRSFISLLSNNSRFCQALALECASRRLPFSKLIRDMDVRWTSTHSMLMRFYELWDVIRAVLKTVSSPLTAVTKKVSTNAKLHLDEFNFLAKFMDDSRNRRYFNNLYVVFDLATGCINRVQRRFAGVADLFYTICCIFHQIKWNVRNKLEQPCQATFQNLNSFVAFHPINDFEFALLAQYFYRFNVDVSVLSNFDSRPIGMHRGAKFDPSIRLSTPVRITTVSSDVSTFLALVSSTSSSFSCSTSLALVSSSQSESDVTVSKNVTKRRKAASTSPVVSAIPSISSAPVEASSCRSSSLAVSSSPSSTILSSSCVNATPMQSMRKKGVKRRAPTPINAPNDVNPASDPLINAPNDVNTASDPLNNPPSNSMNNPPSSSMNNPPSNSMNNPPSNSATKIGKTH